MEYARLPRDLPRRDWYGNPAARAVYIHLLLCAADEPCTCRGVALSAGQTVSTLPQLCSALGISTQQARTAVEHLKAAGEIAVTAHPKFTVFTLLGIQPTATQQQANSNPTASQQYPNSNPTESECPESLDCTTEKSAERAAANSNPTATQQHPNSNSTASQQQSDSDPASPNKAKESQRKKESQKSYGERTTRSLTATRSACEEKEGIRPLKGSHTPEREAQFAAFWSAYPKKRSKGQAARAWTRLSPSPELAETILAALERKKQSDDWLREDGRFIPYPATWLNAQGWEDEDARPPTPHKRWEIVPLEEWDPLSWLDGSAKFECREVEE